MINYLTQPLFPPVQKLQKVYPHRMKSQILNYIIFFLNLDLILFYCLHQEIVSLRQLYSGTCKMTTGQVEKEIHVVLDP